MIEIASGSVIGKSHVRLHRNNQDAYAHLKFSEEAYAVVCDGCGSGMCSEVGAQLGCELVLNELKSDYVTEWLNDTEWNDLDEVLEMVKNNIVEKIGNISIMMGDYLPNAIKHFFLFTVIIAIAGKKKTFIASIGDGFYAVNGETKQIGPFESNAPPYISYNVIPDAVDPNVIKHSANFKIHCLMESSDVQSIMIGTDGVEDIIKNESNLIPGKKKPVGSISQFWTDDIYFNNKVALDRKLVQLARDSSKVKSGVLIHDRGYLMDDTTIISIRRKEDGCLLEGKEGTDKPV